MSADDRNRQISKIIMEKFRKLTNAHVSYWKERLSTVFDRLIRVTRENVDRQYPEESSSDRCERTKRILEPITDKKRYYYNMLSCGITEQDFLEMKNLIYFMEDKYVNESD